MRNEKNQFNNIGISSELDMPRIRQLMKIGLAAGVMALIGDILLGYGHRMSQYPAFRRL